MSLQRGDIVLVPFPFTDLSRQKARPALVVSPHHFSTGSPDVILAAISSKVPGVVSEFELVIQHDSPEFALTGLRVSSVIRVAKLVTMQQSLIFRTLGKLSKPMLHMFDEALGRAVGLPALQAEMSARREAEGLVQELALRLTRLEQQLAELHRRSTTQ